jgi:hypothetical protein
MRIGVGALLLGVFALVGSTGCAARAEPAAQEAAAGFTRAVAAKDGARACQLLAPATRSELEQSAGQGCPRAILDEDLPRAGAVGGFATFGTMAQVRFTRDVMFVSEFRGGWKVVAAGCSPVPGHPYDCRLQGG